MARPITRKSEKAQRLLTADPKITGAELARKTGLNITSIYRAPWWKEHIKQAADATALVAQQSEGE